jgi:hypothetical protein
MRDYWKPVGFLLACAALWLTLSALVCQLVGYCGG